MWITISMVVMGINPKDRAVVEFNGIFSNDMSPSTQTTQMPNMRLVIAVTRKLLKIYMETTVPMSMHSIPNIIPVWMLYLTMALRICAGPMIRYWVPRGVLAVTICPI